jgi:hypothetical protein
MNLVLEAGAIDHSGNLALSGLTHLPGQAEAPESYAGGYSDSYTGVVSDPSTF